MRHEQYVLGLDIGTNSIGWACLNLDGSGQPVGILDAGARIFPMGREDKTAASKGQARRDKRGMRRNIERKRRRSAALWRTLVELGIAPRDPEEQRKLKDLKPLELRSRGVSEQLSLPEFARAIYNLSKRRGFKSNRKDASDSEIGLVKKAISDFNERLGDKTVGQELASLMANSKSTRARFAGDSDDPLIYFSREMIEKEFELLWDTQARYYLQKLSEESKRRIHDIIFFSVR